jgi:hypothetical protein
MSIQCPLLAQRDNFRIAREKQFVLVHVTVKESADVSIMRPEEKPGLRDRLTGSHRFRIEKSIEEVEEDRREATSEHDRDLSFGAEICAAIAIEKSRLFDTLKP